MKFIPINDPNYLKDSVEGTNTYFEKCFHPEDAKSVWADLNCEEMSRFELDTTIGYCINKGGCLKHFKLSPKQRKKAIEFYKRDNLQLLK